MVKCGKLKPEGCFASSLPSSPDKSKVRIPNTVAQSASTHLIAPRPTPAA